MTVWALCSNPRVGWLTDGKKYKVINDDGIFFSLDDIGTSTRFSWEVFPFATWTRIVETDMHDYDYDTIKEQAAEITRLRADRHTFEKFMAHLQMDVESGHIELSGSTDEAYREAVVALLEGDG